MTYYLIEPYSPYKKQKEKHWMEIAEEEALLARVIYEAKLLNETSPSSTAVSAVGVGGIPYIPATSSATPEPIGDEVLIQTVPAGLHGEFGVFTSGSVNSLTDITINDTINSNGYVFLNNTALQTISLPNLTEMTSSGLIHIDSCSNVNTVSIPNLIKTTGIIAFRSNATLTEINFPSLISSSNITMYESDIKTINFPLLSNVNGNVAIGENRLFGFNPVEHIYLNSLKYISGSLTLANIYTASIHIDSDLTVNGDVNMNEPFPSGSIILPGLMQSNGSSGIYLNGSSLSYTNLTTTDYFFPNYKYGKFRLGGSSQVRVKNIDLSALISSSRILMQDAYYLQTASIGTDGAIIGDIFMQSNVPALREIYFGALSHSSASWNFDGASSASINRILATAVAMGQGHSPRSITANATNCAPPSGQGITDKATLQSWGVTVTTK